MKRTLRPLASLASAVWMPPCATADAAAGLLRAAADSADAWLDPGTGGMADMAAAAGDRGML